MGIFKVGVNDAILPYRVLNAGRLVDACKNQIRDESLKLLVMVGALDQLTHADHQLVNFTPRRQRLADVYRSFIKQL